MREKLIELAQDYFDSVPWYADIADLNPEKLADHLIANGVTIPVRCKDCKHLVLTEEGEHNPNDCVCDYYMTDGLTDNDFCSYGERRTEC